MGNYRFRLSDMMPNAWFYKLKDMSSRGGRRHSSLKKHRPNVPAAPPSSSYSPRTSSSSAHKSRRKTIYRPSSPTPVWTLPAHVPAHSPCDDDASPEPDYIYQRLQHRRCPSHSSSESDSDGDALASFDCKLTSSTTDIIIDISQDQSTSADTTPRPVLPVPPILTKASFTGPRPRQRPRSRSRASSTSSSQEQTQKTSPARTRKPGIKVRGNSPRIQVAPAQARKSVSSVKFRNKNLADSFAVVKSSVDPQRDFWESMVEMIAENDISASKDLEDLLACYLSLNPPYYHPHIVEAFERIWFDMSNLSL